MTPVPGDPSAAGKTVQLALTRVGEALRKGMQQTLDADGVRWEGDLAASIRGPLVLDGSKSIAEDLATRSGGLRRSFGHQLSGTTQLDGMSVQKYTTSPYALIHELGGLITPKNAKYLAIPLPAAMTASGVSRGGPRTYGAELFPWRSKSGALFLVRRKDGGGGPQALDSEQPRKVAGKKKKGPRPFGLELLFLLKSAVWIPPRLQMRAFHERDSDQRLADFQTFATSQLAAAFPAGGAS